MASFLKRINAKSFQNITNIYTPSNVVSFLFYFSFIPLKVLHNHLLFHLFFQLAITADCQRLFIYIAFFFFLKTSRNAYVPAKYIKRLEKGTIKHRNLIASDCESLAAKGFLRSQKPYTPAPDVEEKVDKVCKEILGSSYDLDTPLPQDTKFHLLNICFKKIGYSIPNSLLCHVTTPKEVLEFYKTPRSTTTPYDELRNRNDLPPNLYLQPDHLRYNPDKDPFKFSEGDTTFPFSSTLVTGLKSRQKYKSIIRKPPYHYYNEANYIKPDKV